MLAVEKAIGRKPKELEDLIELPKEFSKVWEDFLNLSNSRSSGLGISPISYAEIDAYSRLLGIDLEPWEVQVIKLFDRVTLSEVNKQQEKKSKK